MIEIKFLFSLTVEIKMKVQKALEQLRGGEGKVICFDCKLVCGLQNDLIKII